MNSVLKMRSFKKLLHFQSAPPLKPKTSRGEPVEIWALDSYRIDLKVKQCHKSNVKLHNFNLQNITLGVHTKNRPESHGEPGRKTIFKAFYSSLRTHKSGYSVLYLVRSASASSLLFVFTIVMLYTLVFWFWIILVVP